MADIQVPSAGLFPQTFPRDPINVNIYLEHLLLGQIIEPLVEVSDDGSIQSAVAKSWKVENDGKIIKFELDPNAKFSTGKPIEAEDVIYTLKRHLESDVSQAKSYLSNIESMEGSKGQLTLYLKRPYMAIFKALSRDQLGILPRGWVFDPNSSEPFVSSGSYRTIQKNGNWFLIANPFYRLANKLHIKEWKIIKTPTTPISDPTVSIPDYMPFLLSSQIEDLNKKIESRKSTKIPMVQFSQSLAWWYRRSEEKESSIRQSLGMKIYQQLAGHARKKHGLTAATGIIPIGISGYLNQTPNLPERDYSSVKNRSFVIAAVGRDADLLKDDDYTASLAKNLGVQIKLIAVPLTEISHVKQLNPDILVISYAGGFQDPEGFLTVITSFLNADLKTVFGKNYSLYEKASAEMDWSKRSALYQELNRTLLLSEVASPGWRWDAYRVCASFLTTQKSNLGYTLKFRDLSIRKEAL